MSCYKPFFVRLVWIDVTKKHFAKFMPSTRLPSGRYDFSGKENL